MDSLIIAAIASLVVLFLLYKFARGVFKIVGFLFFIATIILAIITVFVFIDIRDFKNHAGDMNTMLLVKEDRIIAAMNFSFTGFPQMLSEAEVRSAAMNYQTKNFDAIRNGNYKAYFADYSSILVPISFLGIILPAEKVDEMISSNQTPQETKNMIFAVLLSEKIKKDPLFIFTGYRQGSIAIYPETALFLFIKYVPDMVVEKATMIAGSQSKTAPAQAGNELEYAKVN